MLYLVVVAVLASAGRLGTRECNPQHGTYNKKFAWAFGLNDGCISNLGKRLPDCERGYVNCDPGYIHKANSASTETWYDRSRGELVKGGKRIRCKDACVKPPHTNYCKTEWNDHGGYSKAVCTPCTTNADCANGKCEGWAYCYKKNKVRTLCGDPTCPTKR